MVCHTIICNKSEENNFKKLSEAVKNFQSRKQSMLRPYI